MKKIVYLSVHCAFAYEKKLGKVQKKKVRSRDMYSNIALRLKLAFANSKLIFSLIKNASGESMKLIKCSKKPNFTRRNFFLNPITFILRFFHSWINDFDFVWRFNTKKFCM